MHLLSSSRIRRTFATTALLLPAVLLSSSAAARDTAPFAASQHALQLDKQIDWTSGGIIAVQDANRYKTLESFARERVMALYGKEHLPGLSPLASFMDLLLRREAYMDTPLLRLKDRGLQLHLTANLPEATRQRVLSTGYLTPRELFDQRVQTELQALEPRFEMQRAVNRVRDGEATLRFLDRMLRIVPRPQQPADALWYTPDDLQANAVLALPPEDQPSPEEIARQFGAPAPDVTPQQAVVVMEPWLGLGSTWQAGDAAGVQRALNNLAAALPTLAAEGVYPAASQRAAEARYYKYFTSVSIFSRASLGWLLYLIGALVGVLGLVTKWRGPWVIALLLLVAALAWHAYGITLRWYILGRIPVANMFEALTFSAWVGIALALVVELIFRTRVFLVAGHVLGFCSLIVASYALPGGAAITSIMGILDNIMLRIHTVMIISSYALIFLASVIAVVYLFGYYFTLHRVQSAVAGLAAAGLGLALWVVSNFAAFTTSSATASGAVKLPMTVAASTGVAIAAALALAFLWRSRGSGLWITGLTMLLCACVSLIVGDFGFVQVVAWTLIAIGLGWALLTGIGHLLAQIGGGPAPGLAPAGAGAMGVMSFSSAASALRWQRPILAGAAPGDESDGARLPTWLHHMDWSHLIILNMAFVMLFFGGIVLGAMWADYSWGRPWGWDPKETFALNTWLIYAVLIHARFVVKRKGLWTAWLSVLGCAMMAFNWFVVNFYIVGLHSYA